MLRQTLNQKLLQRLSPQQIQFIKLLQVPTAQLEQRIKQELEENPALEEGFDDNYENFEQFEQREQTNDDSAASTKEFDENPSAPTAETEIKFEDEYSDISSNDDIDVSEYLEDFDHIAEYKLNDYNYSPEDEERDFQIPVTVTDSFYEQLEDQLEMLNLPPNDYRIAKQIIGSIEEDGYLRRPLASIVDDLAFRENHICTDQDAERMLKLIQTFEPSGIGARDLQECLILQLKHREQQTQVVKNAIRILQNTFDEYTKKHYDKICKSINITEKDLKAANAEILKLNPKPGNANKDNNRTLQIIPDFLVYGHEGELQLKLNARNAPELKISASYRAMLHHYDKGKDKKMKDTITFVKQKLDSAKWFIEAIKQRQNTLITTMSAIVQHQQAFFLTGDESNLKPMILKDIAEEIGLDISTISRVASSKYVQTEFGTFILKEFFSEGIMTDTGEEASSKEVKKILADCVAQEDKKIPLSDDRLAEILNEKGYNIARRTIAKYREQLGIAVARLRKEL